MIYRVFAACRPAFTTVLIASWALTLSTRPCKYLFPQFLPCFRVFFSKIMRPVDYFFKFEFISSLQIHQIHNIFSRLGVPQGYEAPLAAHVLATLTPRR